MTIFTNHHHKLHCSILCHTYVNTCK